MSDHAIITEREYYVIRADDYYYETQYYCRNSGIMEIEEDVTKATRFATAEEALDVLRTLSPHRLFTESKGKIIKVQETIKEVSVLEGKQ